MTGRLLVTGADGFAGRYLVPAAAAAGWEVVAVLGPGGLPVPGWREVVADQFPADLTRPEDRKLVAGAGADVVIHLAAVSSGAAARRDPEAAMLVNAAATGELAVGMAAAGTGRFIFVSTGEVYGAGHDGPIPESTPLDPVSPYAVSKVAAEGVLRDAVERSDMGALVVRAFPHTGPGQSTDFVLPAFAARLREAGLTGRREVPVGNLDVTRDFLDVRDVVRAYLLLASADAATGEYNVASGAGRVLADCFDAIAGMTGSNAVAVQDPSLVRPADIKTLVGDSTRLREATGWLPTIPFEQTLQDLVDAQAH